MLLAVVGSLIYSRERKSNESSPSLSDAIEVWNELEIRVLVIASLCLQILLIIFGNRRKYIEKTKLYWFLWFIYLSADWIATLALGILSKHTKEPTKNEPNLIFVAIWAPFLLLHLGGPDTITAYSLEDNELWKRHLLELLYQLAVALYVVYRSWKGTGTPLNYVSILVVLAGIIKYTEKTWSLRSGSAECFRDSILPSPDPGPNYAKFMDDYTAKIAEGYIVTLTKVIETAPGVAVDTPTTLDHSEGGVVDTPILKDIRVSDIQAGFEFYNIPNNLFADLILSFQEHTSSQNFFKNTTWQRAFAVVAVELGLIYDVLHTKAVLTYKRRGIYLKLVSFFSTLIAFIAFSFLIHLHHDDLHNKGPAYDPIITFVLFIGAILLEIYALIVLLSSSWAIHWVSNIHKNWTKVHLKSISCFQKCFKLSDTITWSNHMSQFNLIRFCFKNEPIKCLEIQKFFRIYGFFENFYYRKIKNVSPELKELIFKELAEKSVEAKDIKACKKLCAHKGDRVLEELKEKSGEEIKIDDCNNLCANKGDRVLDDINLSIKEVDFDQSILLWHIATDLCYHSDEPDLNPAAKQSRETSQLLSDYMLYLLVMCPFLLPNGIGKIRFADTCAEVDELLKERKYISKGNQLCKMILRVSTDIPPSKFKGDRSKSVLFDACRLAKSIQSLEKEENGLWSKEKKWAMISRVWVEMLCHAASQCRGLQHAKQLSKGGELLTHVWLLMAHLGITEQFQISEGHARAKLKLE